MNRYTALKGFPYRTRHLTAGESFEADEKLGTLLVKMGKAELVKPAEAEPAPTGKKAKRAAQAAAAAAAPIAPPPAPAAPPPVTESPAPATTGHAVGFMKTSHFPGLSETIATPPAAPESGQNGNTGNEAGPDSGNTDAGTGNAND